MHKYLGPLAFVVTALFFLYEFVSRIAPSLASDAIAHDFNLSHAEFGTLASLFFWVYAPMQLVVGLMLDRFQVRRLVLPAIAICASGVLVFAWAPNVMLAGVGRLAAGLGASFGFVGALYVVNHWFAPTRFALLSGVVNAVGMAGAAVGAIVLTGLIEVVAWRQAFIYIALSGFVIFVAAFLVLRDPPTSQCASERQRASVIGKLHDVVSVPKLWLIALVGALYYMPINVFGGLWGNAEIVADHNLSSVGAETAISLLYWGMAVGSVGSGWLSDRLGHRKWLVVGGAIAMAACFSVAIYAPVYNAFYLSVLLFFGGMFGGGQMLTFAMAKERLPVAVTGTVIAFVNMVAIGSALLFQPLIGMLVDGADGHFGIAMLTIPVCLLVAAFFAATLTEECHPDHIQSEL